MNNNLKVPWESISGVYKFLEILAKHDELKAQRGIWTDVHAFDVAEDVLRNLNSNEKEALVTVIKSMTLLTSGNVAAVRDPNKYQDGGQPWAEILNYIASMIFGILKVDINKPPTRKDYVVANQLLPSLSYSKVDFNKTIRLLRQYKGTEETVDQGDENNYKILYRGLRDMPLDSILKLMLKQEELWDVTRGVSTSSNQRVAKGFAMKQGPYRILFKIHNPQQRGLRAGYLSRYSGENETILGGYLKPIRSVYKFNDVGVRNILSSKQKPCAIEFKTEKGQLTLKISGGVEIEKSGSEAEEIFVDFIKKQEKSGGKDVEFRIGFKVFSVKTFAGILECDCVLQ